MMSRHLSDALRLQIEGPAVGAPYKVGGRVARVLPKRSGDFAGSIRLDIDPELRWTVHERRDGSHYLITKRWTGWRWTAVATADPLPEGAPNA